MSNQNIIYLYENDTGDEIKLELFPTGHFRVTIDFLKTMSEEQALLFGQIARYKLKKAPLRRIK